MMLGFIKSNFPNEKRVPLLPKHINDFQNKIAIESGLGEVLHISDQEYEKQGAVVLSRSEIFDSCKGIFSLKLIQPSDYENIKKNQIIIGWTHPKGSGKAFMENQAIPKSLIIVDLDNKSPKVFYKNKEYIPKWIPNYFINQNSFYAGYAGAIHALLNFGFFPDNNTKIAILGAGNVSQGAFQAISKFTTNVKMYYRRTLPQFKKQIDEFDIIVNGIEVGDNGKAIVSSDDQRKIKDNCFIIDIAADVGNAIEHTHFTTIDNPIYYENEKYYYAVPNTPSLVYRNISEIISCEFSKYVYSKDINRFVDLVNAN